MVAGVYPKKEEKQSIAMIAHDLRAPMCCVSGAAQVALAKVRQGKAVEEQLEQILQAVAAMDRMLKGVCGENVQHDVSARQIEKELRALIAPRTAAKYQRASVDMSALYDREIPLPFDALYRVLSNLLLNAVKYTGVGGEIALRAHALRCGRKEMAVFAVSDSGMGMKEDFMQKMYEANARAKESAFLPGRGMGLAIVRQLVMEMGGEIEARSEWGRGSTFVVRLPLDTCAADRAVGHAAIQAVIQ